MIIYYTIEEYVLETNTPIYKRVLLKLSGEAISNGKDGILNFEYIEQIASVIKHCMQKGVQFGIIVGAGNIWRGRSGENMDRVKADHMGMLATCINALALQEAFIRQRNPGTDLLHNGLVGSPCSPGDSQESSPTPQFKSINSSVLCLLHSPTLTSIHDHWKNHSLD